MKTCPNSNEILFFISSSDRNTLSGGNTNIKVIVERIRWMEFINGAINLSTYHSNIENIYFESPTIYPMVGGWWPYKS